MLILKKKRKQPTLESDIFLSLKHKTVPCSYPKVFPRIGALAVSSLHHLKIWRFNSSRQLPQNFSPTQKKYDIKKRTSNKNKRKLETIFETSYEDCQTDNSFSSYTLINSLLFGCREFNLSYNKFYKQFTVREKKKKKRKNLRTLISNYFWAHVNN